jgi:hypothetical protein
LLLDRPENLFKNDLRELRAKASIAQVSLAYLFQASQNYNKDNKDEQFPLQQFAARYWTDYATSVEEDESVSDWIFKLFTTKSYCNY